MTAAVILGSAFGEPVLGGQALAAETVRTRLGDVTLHRTPGTRPAWVLFRHGVPHRWLPHQIPYRAQTLALREVGVKALLVTSSVGVMDARVPLFRPLLVSDLFMPDNRLPDGSACTVHDAPGGEQSHLVLDGGLCDAELGAQVERLADGALPRVVFAYVGGPRTKTRAENRWLATTGAQVNSMTVGPELVLANELGIATAAVVAGHKHSLPVKDHDLPAEGLEPEALRRSLVSARVAVERLAARFLAEAEPVAFKNRLYTFGA